MFKLLWTKDFKTRWSDRIFAVPELNSVYYVNGSNMFAAMRIRRLDLQSGEELSSFLTRSFVYNLAFSSDFSEVFANTERKLFVLSSKTLSQIKRCESRVPSNTTSMIHYGNVAAMKGEFSGDVVNMYDLDTMKVKRLKVGEGGPLFRDVEPGNFLACCGLDGNVWRIDATSGKTTKLFSGIRFDCATIDHNNARLWFSGASPREISRSGYDISGPSTKRLHSLSLKPPFEVENFELGFEFTRLSITKDGDCLWVGKERYCDNCKMHHHSNVEILSVNDGFKAVGEFESPDEEKFAHMDARAGLIFTEESHIEEEYFVLKCWRMESSK